MEKVQKTDKSDTLKKRLRKELNWYTLYASEEEYDEKAVESILYLLDTWDPLDEETMPDENAEWEKFQKLAGQKELLPLPEAVAASDFLSASGKSSADDLLLKKDFMLEKNRASDEIPVLDGDSVMREKYAAETGDCGNAALSGVPGGVEIPAATRKKRIVAFALRHKVVVAAIFVLMIFAVGNSIHAVANPDTGFFFWLNRDDSGVEMMTSPEEISDLTDTKGSALYNREEIPEWGQEWLQIESEIEMPEGYEWQYFEVNDLLNRKILTSYYFDADSKRGIVIGIFKYLDKVSYYREEFIGYSYIQSYELLRTQMDIYSKEESGEIWYLISFYEEDCKYFVSGQDDLLELKVMMEKYLTCVQNNS